MTDPLASLIPSLSLSPLSILLLSFLLALLLTPLARRLAPLLGAVDVPVTGLSIHAIPIPRTGGLAMLAAFLGAMGAAGALGLAPPEDTLPLMGVLVGAVIVALAGLLDDVRHVSPITKMLWQLLGAAIAVGLGVQVGTVPLAGAGFALGVVYLAGGANALNLLDGMDGLAAGVTAIAALFLAGLAALQGHALALVLALALAGAALGFLPYNFPRASLFMGDVGSLTLGFTLAAVAALLANRPGDLGWFLAPLLVIALPVVDTALAMARRFMHLGDLFTGDREHVYDLATRRGLSNTATVLLMYAVTLALGLTALAVAILPPLFGVPLALAALLALVAAGVWLGALGRRVGDPVAALRRVARRYTYTILLDAFLVAAGYYAALGLRLSGEMPGDLDYLTHYARAMAPYVPFVVLVYLLGNAIFGLYNRLWRYASSQECVNILGAVGVATGVVLVADLLWGHDRPIPLSVVLLAGGMAAVAFMALRYRFRLVTGTLWRLGLIARAGEERPPLRTLIVGAGEAGQLLAWRMQHHSTGYQVVGFVDDDPDKAGMRVHGARVFGDCTAIPHLAQQHQVDLIAIAIHNASRPALIRIVDRCLETPARVKIVPDLLAQLGLPTALINLRDVTIDDLLGRPPIPVDEAACRAVLSDKVVLVTGAAGSIGAEICRQAVGFAPRLLVALDHNETGLYDLGQELCGAAGPVPVRYAVGDVTDTVRLAALFADCRPQVVFHCAAYKHVPLMQFCPSAAVKTNVGGTMTLAWLAEECAVERFIYISSDKAVFPQSVMGATKRVSEMFMSTLRSGNPTRFATVRFGNVLGSRGSVVPTFAAQIDAGGPVTVTHPEMRRYFMSIQEAVSLVIQAAAFTTGGDMFILDMGEEVCIDALARRMIRLRGLRPETDVAIRYTGPRPGEKMRELLACPAYETLEETAHPRVRQVHWRNHLDTSLWTEVQRVVDLAEEGQDDEVEAALFALARRDCHAACPGWAACQATLVS